MTVTAISEYFNDRAIHVSGARPGDTARLDINNIPARRTEVAFIGPKQAQELVLALVDIFPGLTLEKPKPTAREQFDALAVGDVFRISAGGPKRIKVAADKYYVDNATFVHSIDRIASGATITKVDR